MVTGCLEACPGCERHVKCGERVCPFCGTSVASFMRVLEYRLLTRLDRSRAFGLGAALTAADFASSCGGTEAIPIYGAPCNPPSCYEPEGGEPGAGGNGPDTGNGGATVGGAYAGQGGGD